MLQLMYKLGTSSFLFLILTQSIVATQIGNPENLLQPAKLLPLASKSIISDLWIQNKFVFAVGERGHILKKVEDIIYLYSSI